MMPRQRQEGGNPQTHGTNLTNPQSNIRRLVRSSAEIIITIIIIIIINSA